MLRWQDTTERETPTQSFDDFNREFLVWMAEVAATHIAFVACDHAPIGVAWLAAVRRAPQPGKSKRVNGDLQSVFVIPERRNQGVGEQLVRTVLAAAWSEDMDAVTVSSGRRAVPLYQRIGFEGTPPHMRIVRTG